MCPGFTLTNRIALVTGRSRGFGRAIAEGMAAMAELYYAGAARVLYRENDPRGWAEFKQQFAARATR